MIENETTNLPYFYSNIDRNKSELIFRFVNRPGCFLIRKHENKNPSIIESPYVLSMIDPSFKLFHYLWYRIDRRLFIKPYSNEFYHSVKDLVDQHRLNAGLLPSKLIEYPIDLNSNIHSPLSSSSSSSSSRNIPTNKLIREEMIGRGHFGIVYKGFRFIFQK